MLHWNELAESSQQFLAPVTQPEGCIAIMVESCASGPPGGFLCKDSQEIMEAFVKENFPNMKTKTRGATLIGVRDCPTKREVTLAMHMLGLYFHSDKGLYDKWANVRMQGVDKLLLQQAKLLLEQLWKIPMSARHYKSLVRATTRRHAWTN